MLGRRFVLLDSQNLVIELALVRARKSSPREGLSVTRSLSSSITQRSRLTSRILLAHFPAVLSASWSISKPSWEAEPGRSQHSQRIFFVPVLWKAHAFDALLHEIEPAAEGVDDPFTTTSHGVDREVAPAQVVSDLVNELNVRLAAAGVSCTSVQTQHERGAT